MLGNIKMLGYVGNSWKRFLKNSFKKCFIENVNDYNKVSILIIYNYTYETLFNT